MRKITKAFIVTAVFLMLSLSLSFSSLAAKRPAAPTQLKVTAVGQDSVSLSWKKSLYADSYRIYVKNGDKWKALKSLEERSCKISGLNASTEYTLAVRSVNSSGGKNYYSEKYTTVKVKTDELSKTTLKARAGVDFVTLSWKKAPGATGYGVYQRVSGKWKLIKELSPSKREYKVKKLDYNTSYQFALRPFVKVNGKKLNGPLCSVKAKTLRANKVTVKMTSSSASSVTLRWSKAADAAGYRIHRYADGEWKTVTTLRGADKLSTVIPSLKSDSSYRFRVRAFGYKDGERVWFVPSDSCVATTDPTKKNLSLSRTSKLKKTLNSESFTLSLVIEDKNAADIPVIIAKKGKSYRLTTKVNELTYVLINTTKADYLLLSTKKAYVKLPSAFSSVTDIEELVQELLPGKKWKGKATLEVYDGQKVVCEQYTSTTGARRVCYYYRAGKLVGIEERRANGSLVEAAQVKKLEATASASFSVPKGYKQLSADKLKL